MNIQEGDKVKIIDGSEAHGDTGIVWFIQSDGIIIVELDANEEKGIVEGTCWPILEENELEIIE